MMQAAHALINIDALNHNVERVKFFAPEAKIMAVIKANAYGHGLLRIAEKIKGVDALAVARIDEAIALRKVGYLKKLVVLEGFVYLEELKLLVENNLDFVVHSEGQVNIIESLQCEDKISIWLKLNSGMNRLGFIQSEFESIYQRLLACSCLKFPISLMTHLSSADDLNSNETSRQISLFQKVVGEKVGERSIANSAAILSRPDSRVDWVRPGIMLYGVSPFFNSVEQNWGLKPVMSLHSRLISVKNIAANEAVGYNGQWVCSKNTRLGIIAIGYGDGYPRYAKNGTPVLVNGKRVPLVGRVSMDIITVDLSTQDNAMPGDSVVLWGEGLAVEEIAQYSETIPYTLLCGITQRVKMIVLE